MPEEKPKKTIDSILIFTDGKTDKSDPSDFYVKIVHYFRDNKIPFPTISLEPFANELEEPSPYAKIFYTDRSISRDLMSPDEVIEEIK